jgi:hypothetical protein
MRAIGAVLTSLALFAGAAFGQTTTTGPMPATNPAPPVGESEADKAWSFDLSTYQYFVPEERNYLAPTLTADRGWLHLEARYNYEALDTGSVWAGYNVSGGEELTWEITPMLGGVFGHTTGIAPGCKGSLSWWKLELYSEGEYLFDTSDSSDSFFYNWSELTLTPVDWFHFGLVTQRTRAYETDRDLQRGFLVRFSFDRFDLAAYVFNPDESHPTVAVSAAVSF